MPTLPHDRRSGPDLDALCAALVGLAVGLSLGGDWQPLFSLLALVTGGR